LLVDLPVPKVAVTEHAEHGHEDRAEDHLAHTMMLTTSVCSFAGRSTFSARVTWSRKCSSIDGRLVSGAELRSGARAGCETRGNGNGRDVVVDAPAILELRCSMLR
jgi:hypothetical protein